MYVFIACSKNWKIITLPKIAQLLPYYLKNNSLILTGKDDCLKFYNNLATRIIFYCSENRFRRLAG